jgi:hypothetical protein
LSEQERSTAQADLDRLTGELVRLYQLREQLKLALSDGKAELVAGALAELPADAADPSEPPLFRVVPGKLETKPVRDPAQRQALRAQFQVIPGGLA